MKFLQVATYYEDYLSDFYARNPETVLLPHHDQMAALTGDGFGALHIVAPHLAALGVDARLVVPNFFSAQKRWLAESRPGQPLDQNWRTAILRAQIEDFEPDVLYLTDPISYDAVFVRSLPRRPRLVIGWRAAEIPARVDWSGFDLIISNNPACLNEALRRGARTAVFHRPGFPADLGRRYAGLVPKHDVVFLGQAGPQHTKRQQFLLALAENIQRLRPKTSLALHLYRPPGYLLPAPLAALDQGARWGDAYYRTMARSRIVLNGTIDFALRVAGNMRLFEATGVGAFLLTEDHYNITDYFAPGREVAIFASPKEMLERIVHYLNHDAERRAIAAAGQDRCLSEHEMDLSVTTLLDLINARLA